MTLERNLNIEEIKKYNTELRKYKEKSAQIEAEIKFNEQELERQCQELSTALGIQVTADNINEILNERIMKIQNTMQAGNEILDRIKKEEMQLANTSNTSNGVNAFGVQAFSGNGVGMNMPSQQTVPMGNSIPVGQAGVTGQAGVASRPDIENLVSGDLPPLFMHNTGVQI